MASNRQKQRLVFIGLALVVLAWTVLFFHATPEEIVAFVGVSNAYLITAIFALIGGISIVSAASFYTTITTFIIGGADPFILALVAGPTLTVADYIFFRLGWAGRSLITGRAKRYIDRFGAYIQRQSPRMIQGIAFFYTAATPFPDDILMIALSFAQVTFRQVFWAILCGNTILILTITALMHVLGIA